MTKLYRQLLLLALVWSLLVVGLGAFTRLVDAGLGCPDWPGCYGHFWAPSSQTEIALANAKFPDHPVDHAKTWPEMVHRYLASGLGLMCFLALFLGWRSITADRPWLIGLCTLVVVQGIFGALTVTLSLLPVVVTLHLLGGFSTALLLWVLVLRQSPHWHPKLGPLCWLIMAALTLQVSLGGWTSANYAALACPDFPTCQQSWWPNMDFRNGFHPTLDTSKNYLGGHLDGAARTAIHVSHRLGALVVAVLLAVQMLLLLIQGRGGAALLLAMALSAQLSLGVINVLYGLPLFAATLHNLMALTLIATLVGVHLIREDAYVASPVAPPHS